MSRGAETLFGYDAKEVAGESFLTLFAPQSQSEAAARFERVRRDEPPARGGEELVRPRPARPDAGARDDPGALRRRRRAAPLLRGGARPRAVEGDRTRAGGGARRRRAGQRAQDRVPRPRQPRSPHAAARHSRLRRSDDGGAVRTDRQRPLQGLRQGHPRLGAACHEPRQRPARSRQDRIGQARARLRAGRRQPRHARMRLADAAAGGARTHHHAPVAVRPPAAR